ncbi:proline dehydrogenase family protein [Paenibacillus darwinianus]|nr:proline dehydrogenase [Paenibacillus darwinianus]EXX85873.1 proline dehydrogenase [Paenibacillus darwinianus]EXX86222.1 proline dehydrogenase [Paenibacillus darwinianus]
METFMRSMLLALARGKLPNRLAKRYGLRLGAGRFVAGVTIREAIETVRELNRQGKLATLDYLGEFVGSAEEAAHTAGMCLSTLSAIAASDVRANLSLKLTSLGLDVEEALCLAHMRDILREAERHGLFVRIDMEDFSHCERTIRIYKTLRREFAHVGIAIQAYLYRSLEDVRDLETLGANLRLVKGAYKESAEVAFPRKADVDAQFLELIRMHLSSGCYTAVATHDPRIVDAAMAFIAETSIPGDRYEFQMLFGIGEELQQRLTEAGCKVRVYVPFGADWFGYFMRRLAERPANVWFVVKNLFRRRDAA